MTRMLLKSAAAAACLLAVAVPATAQIPGFSIKLNPRIGLYTPLTNLGDQNVGTTIDTFELDNSLALGLGVELDLAGPIGVRANLDYATSSSVNTENGDIQDTGKTTVLAVVGDLMWRPLPRIVVLQPYLFVGGGLKQYDFQTENASLSGFEDASDPTVHLGGGLDLGIGPLALNAEVGDYVSWYSITEDSDSQTQHDLFATVGFSIGLF